MIKTAARFLPLSILVADDQPSAVMLLSEVLKKHGHNVTTATTEEQVLAELDTNKYDAVVLDLHMPPTKGKHFISSVRTKLEYESAARLIVVSAEESERERQSVLLAGADDYLVKPVNLNLLLTRVELGPSKPQRR